MEKLAEDIPDLLFNLASADRLTLLNEIGSRKQRLTSLSKIINASAQECSRHLARLSESGFIEKDGEGFYGMTALGKSVLRLFPGLQFLLEYKDYFLSHDLSFLPDGFVERIGQLSSGEHLNHFSLVLEHIKATISKGKEFVSLISDQPIVAGWSVGETFSSRNIPVRLIGEPSMDRKVLAEARAALPKSEIATLHEVKIAMAINESIAGVCFASLDGKIDFSSGFVGKDARFRNWCSELFEYYWAKSRKVLPT
jgi:predicted transcriptional regulator